MRLFKKREDKPEEKELDLRELRIFIETKIKQESDQVLRDVKHIIEDIKAVIKPISVICEEINAIKLDRHELATQYISAMNNAKRNLLSVIKNINRDALDTSNIEDLDNVKKQVTSILSKLGEVTGSHRRVIYELFPSHAKKLKAELGKLQEYSESLNSLIDNYKKRVDMLEDSKEKLLEIARAEKALIKIREEKNKTEDKIKELNKELELVNTQLKDAKEDKDYLSKRELLYKFRMEYNQILDNTNKLLSSISRAINKYDYTIGIEKAPKNILTDIIKKPSTIANIDATLLTSLFNDIIKVIRDKKIQLKSPERDISILEELITKLPNYVTKAREYEHKIKDTKEVLKPFDTRLEHLEARFKSIKDDIEQLDNKRSEYGNKIKDLELLIENNTLVIKNMLEKMMLKIKIKR